MSKSVSQKEFTQVCQELFAHRGWQEFFVPEITALREATINELVYGAVDAQHVVSARLAISVIDQILSFEDRVNAGASAMLEDKAEEGNMIQLAPSPANERETSH